MFSERVIRWHTQCTFRRKDKTNLLEIVIGGNESASETDIVLIWAGQSPRSQGYSPDIYREQEWPQDPPWPLWSHWINDFFAFPPLFLYSSALAFKTRSAWGYTHILPATHSLDCIDVHLCVRPGPLVYPWPLCTIITTHSCHLPLSLSLIWSSLLFLTPSYAITGMISTVDPNVSSHD